MTEPWLHRGPEDDGHRQWEEISRNTAYEAYGRSVVEVDYLLPSGDVETFSVREDRASVAVLALTEDGDILITRQFRPGPGRFVFELPGGYVGDGETPLCTAGRELLEETGYQGDIELVGRCFSDSYSSSVKYCAIGRGCDWRRPPEPDRTEFIQVLNISPRQLRGLLRAGDVADVDLAYMGLDALGLL